MASLPALDSGFANKVVLGAAIEYVDNLMLSGQDYLILLGVFSLFAFLMHQLHPKLQQYQSADSDAVEMRGILTSLTEVVKFSANTLTTIVAIQVSALFKYIPVHPMSIILVVVLYSALQQKQYTDAPLQKSMKLSGSGTVVVSGGSIKMADDSTVSIAPNGKNRPVQIQILYE
jgi:hypothetical protein